MDMTRNFFSTSSSSLFHVHKHVISIVCTLYGGMRHERRRKQQLLYVNFTLQVSASEKEENQQQEWTSTMTRIQQQHSFIWIPFEYNEYTRFGRLTIPFFFFQRIECHLIFAKTLFNINVTGTIVRGEVAN